MKPRLVVSRSTSRKSLSKLIVVMHCCWVNLAMPYQNLKSSIIFEKTAVFRQWDGKCVGVKDFQTIGKVLGSNQNYFRTYQTIYLFFPVSQ
jgi:hypothetical protein